MKHRLGFFFFVLFLCSCGQQQDDVSDKQIFRYNESAGISSLDPAFAKDQANIWAVAQLFNGLVQLDEQLRVQAAIAHSWTVSDDALLYTFHLRTGVSFHQHELIEESRRVVADDFVYSFDRLLDPNLASPGAWVMNNVSHYQAIDDSTLSIRLKTPFPPFLGLLSMPYCSVVPKEVVEQTNFRDHPIGTGPFQFQYWKENVKLVFRQNPLYYEKGLPKLDAVAISFVKDKQAAFLEFLKGNLDFISGIDASYKDEVLTREGDLQAAYQGKIVMQTQPYLNTEYLGFLMDENNVSATQKLAVRQAINYGFDRRKMMTFLRNNVGKAAEEGFVPEGLPSYTEDLRAYSYDPVKAKELWESANWPVEEEIILSTTSSYLDICEYIQHQLSEIGMNVRVEVNPPSTHRQMVATSKLNFFRGSWIADYADAENYLALFYSKNHSPNGPNYTHFSCEAYDALYEEAIQEVDDSLRYTLYHRMDQMIIDSAAIVPLYYDQVVRFVQPNIANFKSNGMNMLKLKAVQIQ
jgi:peptide/nickel transport system substrate-binding protein